MPNVLIYKPMGNHKARVIKESEIKPMGINVQDHGICSKYTLHMLRV